VSTSENKLLIRRFIEEVVNTGDLSRLHKFVAPGFLGSCAGSGIKPVSTGLCGVVGQLQSRALSSLPPIRSSRRRSQSAVT
jgi:hypothetical protein